MRSDQTILTARERWYRDYHLMRLRRRVKGKQRRAELDARIENDRAAHGTFTEFDPETGRAKRHTTRDKAGTLALTGIVFEGEYDLENTVLGEGGQPVTVEPEIVVTAAEVNAYASRLIRRTDWMVIRELDGGKAMPVEIKAYRAAVRNASDEICDMDPIPADFIHSDLWPKEVR